MEESFNESGAAAPTSPTRAGGSGAQLAATPGPEEEADTAAAPAPLKRKMKITHDRYVQIRSLVVYHIQKSEAEQSRGIDRDELIDWYLESREEDLHSVEELEYEKELFTKVLRKLVKENYLIEVKGDVQESLPTSTDDGGRVESQDDGSTRVFYMVHPSVDAESQTSLA